MPLRSPLARAASLAALATVPTAAARAQAGGLDPAFGSAGLVTLDLGGQETGFDVALQPDGRILTAGVIQQPDLDLDFALTRSLPDGSPDPSFGSGGGVRTDFGGLDQAEAVALQPDGRILVAGRTEASGGPQLDSDVALARYLPDGSLDPSFGVGGRVTTDLGTNTHLSPGDGYGLELMPDGRIVFAGLSVTVTNDRRFFALRYLPDGSLDVSFGFLGITGTSLPGALAPAMVLQPDGRILLGGGAFPGSTGHDFALLRYLPSGLPDAGFGTGGVVFTDLGGVDACTALALQPDGRIVAAGRSSDDFALARYLADGSPDPSFGAGGLVTTDLGGPDGGEALVVEPGGRIVVAGDDGMVADPDFLLARYRSDGALDPTFGSGGTVTTPFAPGTGDRVSAMVRQDDGKLVVAGVSVTYGSELEVDFALARYCAGSSAPELAGELVASFDEAVLAGELWGVGPAVVARLRVLALRVLLELAAHLVEHGETTAADHVLRVALLRCDGLNPPRDQVEGPAVPALAQDIEDLRAALASSCAP